MAPETFSESNLFERAVSSQTGNMALKFMVVPLIILVLLFLPSISLANRLMTGGYESIDVAGGTIYATDGAQVIFLPGSLPEQILVKVEVIDADAFMAGTAGYSLLKAADNLPSDLELKSSLYHIQSRGQHAPQAVALMIPMPDGLESPQTLDLYTWDGKTWEWLPNRKLPVKETIEAELDFLPESVAVVQTRSLKPAVSADVYGAARLPADALKSLAEINIHGFQVDTNGEISDDTRATPAQIRDAGLAIVPTIRNWSQIGSTTPLPLDSLLLDLRVRRQHINAIVELVQESGFDGVDLDYRGIGPELRQDYVVFLTRLRESLPEEKQLSVRLELPRQLSTGTWDTGAYDWQAIGHIADVVKVPTWPGPAAYAAGGQMEAMLDWAVSQIDRRKLQLLLRTGSVEWVDSTARDLTDEEALTMIGGVTSANIPAVIDPGQTIDFTLIGLPASTGIQVDEASGTYWFAYLDEANRHHTIYLSNTAGLIGILDLLDQYNLYGVTIQSLPGNSIDPKIFETLRGFGNDAASLTEPRYEVAWRVQSEDGKVILEETVDLSSPAFNWTAPEPGGAFEVAASISSDQAEVSPESMVVFVAAPEPAPKPVQSAPAQPKPAGPPPPAVEPVNVPFGYGIQTDPRGNTGANIGHIQAIGFNWVKFQMAWKDVESGGPGDYSWGMWDELVNAYSANGIKILLSIPKAPDWARPFDDDKSAEGPPEDPGKYAQFVAIVADRYRGRVQAIEIWNEQNLWYEAGGMGRIDAAKYVQLLQMSYQAIKSVNPDMIVVSGALTPAGNVGAAAVDDIDYLNQMYANGVKGFFDALGAHPSGYNCPATGDWRSVQDQTAINFRGPFDNRHHSWCFRGTMEGYREVMVANGDGHKAIVPTEFGWAVSGNPQPGYEYAADNTPEEQAQWMVEAYQLAKNWGWVGPMFLWNLDYGVTAAGTELANFGILNTPAYSALAGMPK